MFMHPWAYVPNSAMIYGQRLLSVVSQIFWEVVAYNIYAVASGELGFGVDFFKYHIISVLDGGFRPTCK